MLFSFTEKVSGLLTIILSDTKALLRALVLSRASHMKKLCHVIRIIEVELAMILFDVLHKNIVNAAPIWKWFVFKDEICETSYLIPVFLRFDFFEDLIIVAFFSKGSNFTLGV